MTTQDVIEKGQAIRQMGFLYQEGNFPWVALGAVAIVAIAAIVALVILDKKSGSLGEGAVVCAIAAIVMMVLMPFLMVKQHDETQQYAERVQDWKSQSAYPYIRTLEHVDRELVSIEKNPEEGEERLIIKYKDEDGFIQTVGVNDRLSEEDLSLLKLEHNVAADEKPYVRFYQLKEKLGHGVVPGNYGLDVHLNKK